MAAPRIIRTVREMQAAADGERKTGHRISLVPTMGYLHEGHTSLIRRARRDGDIVVVSIFVNPTQFGPTEDFSSYPRDFDRDLDLIEANGGNIVFAPTVDEMYPDGFATYVDLDSLTDNLCGASRPGHFRGVATVVAKLFTACRPHSAVFGQKDAQQALVIRRMARDLNLGVEVLVSPTIREADGLARSSRNVYLSDSERRSATVLFHALQLGRDLLMSGERRGESIRSRMWNAIDGTNGAEVDYVEAVDAESLAEEDELDGNVLLAVAVRFGKARLIDNIIIRSEGGESA